MFKLEDIDLSKIKDKMPDIAISLLSEIKEVGGKGLLVGGYVRDMFFNIVPKDIDVEVFGIESDLLESIASKYGKLVEVGKAFGILKLYIGDGVEIDLSLPRIDSKIASGHRGFEVKTNPFMSIEEASKRRDFTINSMSFDPLTAELYDPYNGIKHLEEKKLAVTDEERFKDDPLRVLRGVQFAARFDLKPDEQTLRIFKEMVPLLAEISKERILDEWSKLFLKSTKPSTGLQLALETGIIDFLHPEIKSIIGCEQEPEWHPEGDVWQHTLFCLDKAADIIRREELTERESLAIMFGTLCHDFGKPFVSELTKGRITSYGHEKAGKKPTEEFLSFLGVDNLTKEKAIKLVRYHMMPSELHKFETVNKQNVKDGTIRRLAMKLFPANIYELTLVAEADFLGRGPFVNEDGMLFYPDDFVAGRWLLAKAEAIAVSKDRPENVILGRDMINLGYEPGEDFGKIIKYANDLRDLKAYNREKILKLVIKAGDTKSILSRMESLLNRK